MLLERTQRKYVIYLSIILYLILNRKIFGDLGSLSFYSISLLFMLIEGFYKPASRYIMPLILVSIIGIIVGMVKYSTYPVMKDLFYFLSPLFTLYAGVTIAKRVDMAVLIRALVIIGIEIGRAHV